MPSMLHHEEHLPEPLPAEPLERVAEWLADAARANLQPNPNAMVLATADASAAPSARGVCGIYFETPDYQGFSFAFFSLSLPLVAKKLLRIWDDEGIGVIFRL